MPTVKIKDVALAVGLAESTVSRILNEKAGYSYDAETRQRVREAASRLGYQANAAARLLKQQKKNLVGLAVQFTPHPYLNRLICAVRDELKSQGFVPILVEPEQFSPTNHLAPFPSPEMLAGLLGLDPLGQEGIAYYQSLCHRVPVVVFYPLKGDELNWVYSDDARGMELLVEHLVGLGHERIAFVASAKSQHHSERLKIEGWHRAVRRFKLANAIQYTHALSPQTPIEERSELMVQHLLTLQPRPTALICSGDESALCVMGRLQERGWKIPHDLSICGYDGIATSSYVHPRLTTLQHPVEAIARAGVARLREIATQGCDEILAYHQIIEPKLLARASTATISSDKAKDPSSQNSRKIR